MGVSVAIEYKPTPVFDRILAKMGPADLKKLAKAGAEGAAAATRSWLLRLAASRHATADRLGAKKTDIIHLTAVNTQWEERGGENYVVVPHRMFRRAFEDVTIQPREAKALAIPVHKDAYGHSPKTMAEKFFIWKKERTKDDKGAAFLARTKGKGKNQRLELLFLLYRGRILQKQDPTLLPDGDTMAKAALRGVKRALDKELKAAKSGGGSV